MAEKMQAYFDTKDAAKRNTLLKELALACPPDGKDFFYRAFKRERYPDMKLTAVRGLCFLCTRRRGSGADGKSTGDSEKAAGKDAVQLSGVRGDAVDVLLLPYLMETYGYPCFAAFYAQLERQYDAMPEVFKHIFTCDERGNMRPLRDKQEVQKSLSEFFEGIK